MNTKVIILSILSVFSFYSCTYENPIKTSKQPVYEIFMDINKTKDIFLKDFVGEIRYIKLETNKENSFSGINKLVVNSKGIFILDQFKTRKVYHFSHEGKFLASIGKMGKGPGEYILPSDFIYDKKTNTIEIADNFTRAISIYNLNGDFIKKIYYNDYRLNAFTKLNNGNYLVKLGKNKGSEFEKYNFLLTGPDMRTISKFITSEYEIDFVNKQIFSNQIENTLLFNIGLNDTIYQFKDDSYSALYYINFGKLKFPSDMLKQDEKSVMPLLLTKDYASYISNLIQLEELICFSFLSKRKTYMCFLNPETKNYIVTNNIVGEGDEVYSKPPNTIYNAYLYFNIDAFEISKNSNVDSSIADSNKKTFGIFDDIKDIQRNTNLDDNSILVMIKPNEAQIVKQMSKK